MGKIIDLTQEDDFLDFFDWVEQNPVEIVIRIDRKDDRFLKGTLYWEDKRIMHDYGLNKEQLLRNICKSISADGFYVKGVFMNKKIKVPPLKFDSTRIF